MFKKLGLVPIINSLNVFINQYYLLCLYLNYILRYFGDFSQNSGITKRMVMTIIKLIFVLHTVKAYAKQLVHNGYFVLYHPPRETSSFFVVAIWRVQLKRHKSQSWEIRTATMELRAESPGLQFSNLSTHIKDVFGNQDRSVVSCCYLKLKWTIYQWFTNRENMALNIWVRTLLWADRVHRC